MTSDSEPITKSQFEKLMKKPLVKVRCGSSQRECLRPPIQLIASLIVPSLSFFACISFPLFGSILTCQWRWGKRPLKLSL